MSGETQTITGFPLQSAWQTHLPCLDGRNFAWEKNRQNEFTVIFLLLSNIITQQIASAFSGYFVITCPTFFPLSQSTYTFSILLSDLCPLTSLKGDTLHGPMPRESLLPIKVNKGLTAVAAKITLPTQGRFWGPKNGAP